MSCNMSCNMSNNMNEDMNNNIVSLMSVQYSICNIEFNIAGGSNRYVAFDHLGRPHKALGSVNDFVTSLCKITLHAGTKESVVAIYPETGYTKILTID